MYKQTIVSNNFAFGEIGPELYGRGDIDAYKNGAMMLRNMNILATGGLKRRQGLKFIDNLDGKAKLIPFEYSVDALFLLVFMEDYIHIYSQDGEMIKTLPSPYKLENLNQIRWAQKGNELYLVNPDLEPQIIKFLPITKTWEMNKWVWKVSSSKSNSYQPFNRFNDVENISVWTSGTSGHITVASTKELFDQSYVGVRLWINGGEVEIKEIQSNTRATAVVISSLSTTNTDNEWLEQAFSKKRGYPKSITFHQNRLVIGGSKSIYNRVWFSKTGDYLNFDLGEGLDDNSIEFDLLSDKVNEIVCVFSGRHLQVFTSDSEWMITGAPLTPSSIIVKQQTKIGSLPDRFIMPKLVEGSTIFIARNGHEVREFFYGDTFENYSSQDLILLSSHLMNNPIEQDYDIKRKNLYIIQQDGSISMLIVNKITSVSAWTKIETEGEFISVCVIVDKVFVIVKRNDNYMLEVFCDDIFTDCSVHIKSLEGVDEVSGLDHLEGRVVSINADNNISEQEVIDGKISLERKSYNVFAGLSYSHIYCPLPILNNWSVPPKLVRLLSLTIRVLDTPLLQIDTGDGIRNISALKFDRINSPDESVCPFSGDIHIKGRGFIRNFDLPLFKIQSSKPYELKILSISSTTKIVN